MTICLSCGEVQAKRPAQAAQLKEPLPDRMGVVTHTIQEKRLMLKTARSFHEALSQYLTPQLWKQVLGAWRHNRIKTSNFNYLPK
jgi:hypothetical protein